MARFTGLSRARPRLLVNPRERVMLLGRGCSRSYGSKLEGFVSVGLSWHCSCMEVSAAQIGSEFMNANAR